MENTMITLYQFGTFYNLPDPSPFCLKVDAFLRLAKLPFETKAGMEHMRKAPKGKLPYIDDGSNRVPDSEFIIQHLKNSHADTINQHLCDAQLTDEQLAIAHACTKMLDENLYWCLVSSRWSDDKGWAIVKELFFGTAPWPVRTLVAPLIRRSVIKNLKGQGIGRHSAEEQLKIAGKDLKALSTLLGDKPYFFGDTPSSLDATAYGFLAELILPPVDLPLCKVAQEFENLVNFCQRIQLAYYSEA